MSEIPPTYFHFRPVEEQTECDITSPTSDISDIEVSDGDDTYNPSENEEINSSSDEIEVEKEAWMCVIVAMTMQHDVAKGESSSSCF